MVAVDADRSISDYRGQCSVISVLYSVFSCECSVDWVE
jgi:hypothetical protein